MISDKEKKKRQHLKELNSLRNKMGKDIIWFDALSNQQQYDFLFLWKKEKWKNNKKVPQKKTLIKKFGGYVNGIYKVQTQKIEVVSYPPNLKYFTKEMKPKFSVNISKMRESQLKHLLK